MWNNYRILFFLKIFKSVLMSFVDSFLILYFLDVSDKNILPLGIYKLVAVIAIYITIFAVRNINKTSKRVYILRAGIIMDFLYFATLIALKEKVIDYIYLVGLLYGVEEGLYYSVFNVLESDGIRIEERSRYMGTYSATQSVLSMVFPIFFGTLIRAQGFLRCLFVVLVIVALRIVLSFYFRDNNIPPTKEYRAGQFKDIMRQDKRIQLVMRETFFEGMTISEGAFSYIVTIYIARVFSDSFSLGIFTSIFAVVSTLCAVLFARVLKPKYYLSVIRATSALALITMCLMLVRTNVFTIITFKFFYTVMVGLVGLINMTSIGNVSNLPALREYKVEYYLANEKALVVGRVISNLIFIIMAYLDSGIIIVAFVLFLALYALSSAQMEKEIRKGETA